MISKERMEIATKVAEAEGLDIETVIECWGEFKALPKDRQDRFMAYFSDDDCKLSD